MIMLAIVAGVTAASAQNKGYDKANMDLGVKPGTDFVQYSTGSWLKSHPLDAEHPTNGAFVDLYEKNQLQINELVLQFANQPQKPGTLGYKIGTLYNLVMDSVRLNREGYAPIKPLLEKLRKVEDRSEYFRLTAEFDRRGENTMMFGWGVGADIRNAGHNVVKIQQGGLGLGTTDYYLNDDEQTKAVREAYKEYGRKLCDY